MTPPMKDHAELIERLDLIVAELQGLPHVVQSCREASAALQQTTERVREMERIVARQHRQASTNRTFWVRAAKAALAGDSKELRLRVDLAEAPPVDVVLSDAILSPETGGER